MSSIHCFEGRSRTFGLTAMVENELRPPALFRKFRTIGEFRGRACKGRNSSPVGQALNPRTKSPKGSIRPGSSRRAEPDANLDVSVALKTGRDTSGNQAMPAGPR